MDRKVDMGRTGRFTGLGRKSPDTHRPEGHVEYGLERRMCVSGILGNSLSFLLTVFACNVFQVLVRTVGRRRHDSYTHRRIWICLILGFDMFCIMTMLHWILWFCLE